MKIRQRILLNCVGMETSLPANVEKATPYNVMFNKRAGGFYRGTKPNEFPFVRKSNISHVFRNFPVYERH